MIEGLQFDGRPKLPIVLSAEAAECGLACLTMVGGYYGHEFNLNALRQRFSVSISGLTLRDISRFSSALGFSSRALRADIRHLPSLKMPAILHWDLKHFVVLASFDGKRAVVHDPSYGRRVLSAAELSDHFTGVALELSPASTFTKLRIGGSLRLTDLWGRLDGFGSAATHVLGLSVALQVCAFSAPFFLQLAVDQGIYKSDRDFLVLLALGFGALALLQVALEALRSWTITVLGHLFTFQIVGNIVRHLLRLRADYFEKRHVGDILSRLDSLGPIRDAVTRGLVASIIDGVMAIIASILLAIYSLPLALIVLVSFAISIVSMWAFYPASRRHAEDVIIATAKEQTHLMETVRSASIIKLMGREPEREGAWRNLYAKVINASTSSAKVNIAQSAAQSAVSALQTIVIVYVGALLVLKGDGFSIGMLFAFLAYRQIFNDRAASLISQIFSFRLLSLHLDRLLDIVGASAEETGALSSFSVRGGIALQQVRFRYGDSEPWVLDGVDIEVLPGELVAIVGRSGGGKTSLTKILLGLHQPTEGRVLLDGREASELLWPQWRQSVGFVSQDDRLLGGTIAENIAFFDPEMDMSRVSLAARQANIAAEIEAMPMQYLSVVGDMGSNLSGGQKQRVLLARALYRQPRLLLLDEGTANLDPASEEIIANTIQALSCTRVVVSHRPALVERADRIFACEAGKLREITIGSFHAHRTLA